MAAQYIDNIKTKILNSGTETHKADRFNVRFLGIPENLSDFLSRQVRSITPVTISFSMLQHNNRRATFQDIGKIEKEPLTMLLSSDDQGILDSIIMAQLFRQKGNDINGFPEAKPFFDVKIEYMDIRGSKTRDEVYRRCIIQSYTRTDLTVDADTPMTYTLTLAYDSLDHSLEGEDNTVFNV